ncbi:hypothetical protein [Ottowia sp.]|uniref:hypothetical protein n=1 Tax=Ottowia sp. TaxID=1898956 RepID=UPI003A89B44D
MSSDDPPGFAPPRFVPTLTQVVAADDPPTENALPALPSLDVGENKPSPTAPAAAIAVAAAAHPQSPPLSTADAVLRQIGPELEHLISEAIARVLHEQMLGLNARVRKTVAEVVHEAVAKALAQGIQRTDTGKNP